MSYDEDPPTRRLPVPPREPGPPRPRERQPTGPGGPPTGERPVAAAASDVQLYALEQQLRSMRTWLTALAVLAVVALGVAAWALVSSGDDDSSSSARTPASLRKSVDRLEQRVDDRATKGDVSDLQDDITALQKTVEAADTGAAETTTTEATQAPDVSGLQESLSDLSSRVDALEQGTASEGTATEGATP